MLLWNRIRAALSSAHDREFSVKNEKVDATLSAAKKSEDRVLNQLYQLNLALKNARE